jgi:long-chain acyl-CoA synthetase
LYDTLIFNKVKAKFGGNLRILLVSSAPMSAEVLNFFKIALGFHIYEAYG